jgi:hypothetical protein
MLQRPTPKPARVFDKIQSCVLANSKRLCYTPATIKMDVFQQHMLLKQPICAYDDIRLMKASENDVQVVD